MLNLNIVLKLLLLLLNPRELEIWSQHGCFSIRRMHELHRYGNYASLSTSYVFNPQQMHYLELIATV